MNYAHREDDEVIVEVVVLEEEVEEEEVNTPHDCPHLSLSLSLLTHMREREKKLN